MAHKIFDAKCNGKDRDPTMFARQGQGMAEAPSLVATVLNKPTMQLLRGPFRIKELLIQVLAWRERILAYVMETTK